ncbi:MAG TPA: DUF420 domain-containing protein [Longimicrobiales bacterium]|nr:DUF420 domain-containing protein [Longimicrobiales bacterium]
MLYEGAAWIRELPHLNAGFNAVSALLLGTGYLQLRRGRRSAHRTCMVAALGFSGLFLASYLVYHFHVGSVRFTGDGWIRTLYFTILTSHTICAMAIVPLVAVTLYRAVTGQYERHRAVARWTLPAWLYVCVSGVAVYLLLYVLG